MNIMKRIINLLASAMALSSTASCDIMYSLDLENQYTKGIYI